MVDMYAIRFTCKETTIVKAGTQIWVAAGRDNWPSGAYSLAGVKVFQTPAEAHEFWATWNPYPWYFQPESYEVVAMKPVFTQTGWEPA